MPVKLKNGVILDKTLQDPRSNFEFGKVAARSVFNGKAKSVRVSCFKLTCGCYPHKTSFDVGRAAKSVAVGCVRFSPEDVATVREWMKPTPRRAGRK